MTMCIEGSYFNKNKNSFCYTKLSELKTSSPIKNIKTMCRLSYNKLTNTMYLYKPTKIIDPNKINKNNKNIISLDPGVRTFQTGYSNKGIYEFGKGSNKKIGFLIKKINSICKRFRNRKKTRKTQTKLKHIVDELHWKTIKNLCDNFKTIILGKLSTKKVLMKHDLHSVVKNQLQYTRHYEFNERLKYKCNVRGNNYFYVDESYTTKICGKCGCINEIGKKKLYNCLNCNLVIDRDVNSARNILIKNFGI